MDAYRLRGVLHGAERIFNLDGDEHRVGRAEGCDVQLPVEGVSRNHAVVRVLPEGLEVEDAGSHNGTYVAGMRVTRAPVPPGAEITFGSVRLTVEAVDAEDVELALTVETSEREEVPPATDPELITRALHAVGYAQYGGWLALLQGFIERLTEGPGHDLTGALAFLVESLGAAGCCIVEWSTRGEPVVLAAAGELPELLSEREVRQLDPSAESSSAVIRTAFFDRQPALSVAADFSVSQEPRCLLLWGEFACRLGSAALLGSLVRLVRLVSQETAPSSDGVGEASPKRSGDLAFPDGYHPGTSPAATEMYGQMRQVVHSRLPVLIVGETGVGKEQVARILHASSKRRRGPFVAVNCAAIPGEILEAEMFGIGKGVATGVTERPGRFQLAEGGTLFLDEISEMHPALQAKLLRALEEREVQPLGSSRARKVDVRVVAATNADVSRLMEERVFRRDLYYRLAGHLIEVPPLRVSRDDIPGLVEHFLRTFSRETGKWVRGVTAKSLRLLKKYSWPGNVREVEHEVHRLVDASVDGQVIDAGMLAKRIRLPFPSPNSPRAESDASSLTLEPRLQELEGQLIREALRLSEGKQVEAARLLGISRNGLGKKLKRLGFQRGYSRKVA